MNTVALSICELCPTRNLCLASGLDHSELRLLSDHVRPTSPMKKGEYLYRAGDKASCWFVVRSGVYQTFVTTAGGDEHVTGFHYPGELFGMPGQATGTQRESAIALETSTVCRVQLDDVPKLWTIGSGGSLMRMIGAGEQVAMDQRVNLGQTSAERRVAGFLLQLASRLRRQGRDGRTLCTPMSRTDLANYLGMTLECLSRVLTRFRKAELIIANRSQITLLRPDALSELAGHLVT